MFSTLVDHNSFKLVQIPTLTHLGQRISGEFVLLYVIFLQFSCEIHAFETNTHFNFLHVLPICPHVLSSFIPPKYTYRDELRKYQDYKLRIALPAFTVGHNSFGFVQIEISRICLCYKQKIYEDRPLIVRVILI